MPQVYSRASQTCSRPVWQQPMHCMSSLVSQSWQTDIVGFGSWFMCVCAHARACLGDCIVAFGSWFMCVCGHTRVRISVFVRTCLGDCIVGFGSWFMCVCARARVFVWIRQLVHVCVCGRACLGDCIVGFGSWFVCVRVPGRLHSRIIQLLQVCVCVCVCVCAHACGCAAACMHVTSCYIGSYLWITMFCGGLRQHTLCAKMCTWWFATVLCWVENEQWQIAFGAVWVC